MYGDKLREYRGNSSQLWLAAALDITQTKVSDYEQGKCSFTDEFIVQVCRLFKKSISEFKRPCLTPTLVNLLTNIEKLGLPGNSKESGNQEFLVLHLLLELHTLELENHKLKWRVKQFEDATTRIKKHGPGDLFIAG